jgi:hypothetical protein
MNELGLLRGSGGNQNGREVKISGKMHHGGGKMGKMGIDDAASFGLYGRNGMGREGIGLDGHKTDYIKIKINRPVGKCETGPLAGKERRLMRIEQLKGRREGISFKMAGDTKREWMDQGRWMRTRLDGGKEGWTDGGTCLLK